MGGIFSTKRETVAYTTIQRMIDDASITLSSKVAALHYTLEGASKPSVSITDKSIVDYILEYSNNALPRRADKAYNYANGGSYAYGLPTAGEASVQGVNLSNATAAAITASTGRTVSMVYAFIGDQNYQHFLWKKLEEVYGYNPTTNELTTFSATEGFPCYLQTAKLVFGAETVQNTESDMALQQFGFSTESGECISRTRDLSRLSVAPDVDTDVPDAYVEAVYQYIETIPDVTPPPDAVVNNLSTTTINGYAEKDSSVEIRVNTVFNATVTADVNGYFTHTFGTALVASDTVRTIVRDVATNASTGADTVVPYTNGSPAIVGTDKTITQILRTESLTFDLLDYIATAVVTAPSEADQPPITITGSDAFVQEYDYVQACYTYVESGTTKIGYLTYQQNSGGIPALDALFTMTATTGQFYPRLYARLNSQDLPNTLSPTSNEYKSSKALGKLLGIDWADWSSQLQSSVAENTPINDVHYLFLTFAAPMNTTDKTTQECQYRYWLKMYAELTTLVTVGLLAGTGAKVGKVLEIKDLQYTNYVGFDAVNVSTIVGTIGVEGTYNSEYVNAVRGYNQVNFGASTGRKAYSRNALIVPAHHVYRYQNSPTTYVEVKVFNAKSNHVFAGLSTTAVGTDENLIIPLDRSALPQMTSNERELLFNKCLYLVINMTKVIKTKWFARDEFKVVMAVVAIVITIITLGAGAAAISKAVNFTITEAVKAGLISSSFARGLAIVAIVLSIASGQFNINLVNLTAVQLLEVATIAFQAEAKVYEFKIKDLREESDAFGLEKQQKLDALKAAKELLGNPIIDIDLELLTSSDRSKLFITLGESPYEYMAKNSMNIIETVQGFVSNYVEIMMQPPSLQQLLNKSQRGDDDERITA